MTGDVATTLLVIYLVVALVVWLGAGVAFAMLEDVTEWGATMFGAVVGALWPLVLTLAILWAPVVLLAHVYRKRSQRESSEHG